MSVENESTSVTEDRAFAVAREVIAANERGEAIPIPAGVHFDDVAAVLCKAVDNDVTVGRARAIVSLRIANALASMPQRAADRENIDVRVPIAALRSLLDATEGRA